MTHTLKQNKGAHIESGAEKDIPHKALSPAQAVKAPISEK